MRTLFLSCITLLMLSNVVAAPGDTTRVLVHQAVDMVWYENYDRPVTFPNTGVTYSKILMNYTMGCASTGCSDWDYTTKIELRNPLGFMDSTVATIDTVSLEPLVIDTTWNVFEAKESFELARVITPYGSYMRNSQQGYNPNWKHVHTFDVTDYAPLFTGEKEIRAFYGGWSSGFSVTIEFIFIEGTPPRNVLEVRNLWQSGGNGWNYQNPTHFEQNFMAPKSVEFPANMEKAMLRFIPSGHGFDNNTGCAEFCEKHYYLKVDGTQVDSRLMWDPNCGLNPIFPQGGTWLYDRANWCPGLRTHAFDYELTSLVSASNTHQIDIDIEPIYWSGTQAPVYILETQLFIYGDNNYTVDAALEDIIAPTNKDDHKRFNPVCNQAIVRIKNYGSANLTSATIRYAVNENNWRTFNWTGNLAFGASEIVELPLTETWEWLGEGTSSLFTAVVEQPNGATDENVLNNSLTSEFKTTPRHNGLLEFHFRTNNMPAETTWQLLDGYDNLIAQNVPNLVANTLYRDTFELQPGCYVLKLQDSAKDGLSFWANNAGSGMARLRNLGSSFVYTSKIDFGTSLDYYFTVGHTLGLTNDAANADEIDLAIYPNPSSGIFSVVYESPLMEEVQIEITNVLGSSVYTERIQSANVETFEYTFDLSGRPKGTYFVQISTSRGRVIKKILLF